MRSLAKFSEHTEDQHHQHHQHLYLDGRTTSTSLYHHHPHCLQCQKALFGTTDWQYLSLPACLPSSVLCTLAWDGEEAFNAPLLLGCLMLIVWKAAAWQRGKSTDIPTYTEEFKRARREIMGLVFARFVEFKRHMQERCANVHVPAWQINTRLPVLILLLTGKSTFDTSTMQLLLLSSSHLPSSSFGASSPVSAT